MIKSTLTSFPLKRITPLIVFLIISLATYNEASAQLFYYRIRLSIEGEGTVTKEPDRDRYFLFTTVTLTANPSAGWGFSHWSGDVSSAENPLEIVMNGNKSITANFIPVPPAAIISGSETICTGEPAEINIDLSGLAPWTVVYTDGSSQHEIADINQTPYIFEVSPSSNTTYSLLSVEDRFGNPGEVSGSAEIKVDPLPDGGMVSGENSNLLLGESTGTLVLSDYTGSILKWQKRVNNQSWNDIENTSTTYSEVPSSGGIWHYRAVVESGSCGTAVSEYFAVKVNYPPSASDVEISGSLEIGNTITGSYIYSDQEDDPEGESLFAWYRADDDSGTGETKIPDADEESYTLTLEDANKFLSFEVTPVAETGSPSGTPVKSRYMDVSNAAPIVTDVEISGTPAVSRVLKAEYEYLDPEDDPESGTVIRWYRADDDEGENEEMVHEGVEYTLTLSDEGKYYRIGIIPASSSGKSPGVQVFSEYYGPVINTLPTVSISGPAEFCEGSQAELIFSFTGDGPWTVHYTVEGAEAEFTTSDNPYTLTISQVGTYEVIMLTDAHGFEGVDFGDQHTVISVPTILISNGRYIENFDNGASGWASTSSSAELANSWVFGLPDDEIFTSASSGENIWYTDITNPDAAEQSWVQSPCFDFGEILRPAIAIDLWREFEANRDGAVMQYTADNGKTWNAIGNTGTGINWYNSTQISGMPGGQETGWTSFGEDEEADGWVESRHDLDEVADRKNIRFRVAYGSDGPGLDNKGFAFDHIRIYERSRLVLLEHFTNAKDSKSLEANDIVNTISQDNPNDVAVISYHTSFPETDPINDLNPVDPAARALYYGISTVPYSFMDGGFEGSAVYDYSTREFNLKDMIIRSLADPLFNIAINQVQEDDQLNINIEITSLTDNSSSDLTLHVALTEEEINSSRAGLSDDNTYRNVLRKLLPDAGGTPLPSSFTEGQSQEYAFNWSLENIFNAENMAIVAFIQGETEREVLQTGLSKDFGVPVSVSALPPEEKGEPDITFYPNPASELLNILFSEPLENSCILEVYSLSGNLLLSQILSAGTESFQFSTGNLSTGTYILKVISDRFKDNSVRIMIMK